MFDVVGTFLLLFHVTPAKAGVQGNSPIRLPWMPAFAGMTVRVVIAVKA